MNFLKNLLIIAVLAAVGYGVYTSLTKNTEPGQPAGVAAGWPAAPKVELPSAKASTALGGPLALGESTARPSVAAGSESGGMAAPLAAPAATGPAIAPPMTPVAPYASSAAPFAAPPSSSSPAPPASPAVTLGAPVPPDAVPAATAASSSWPPESQASAPEAVRNLAPPPEAAAARSVPPSSASPGDCMLQSKFVAFMDAVQKKLDEGKFADAHLALSALYGNPDLPADQAKQITGLLDQLAGTVIYSRKHYLEPAYLAQQGDTLDRIAQRYNVPWQLLARINGLMPPGMLNTDGMMKDRPLPVGMEMKVVRGPFEAVVRLDRHELTLLVQNRYAGRFPIGVGRDEPRLEGSYTIRDKKPLPAAAQNQPEMLGAAWIG